MAGGAGSPGASEHGVDVSTSRRVKAADKALEHLHRLIDLRRVAPGETLPAAALIAQEIGVNRVAVLQALQMAQREGLVLVRPGRGGARVIARDDRSHEQRLARALRTREWVLRTDLFREILESGIARTAAERGLSDEGHARASELVRDMRRTADRDAYIAMDVEFHALLARATGSHMLAELATAVRWIFLRALDAVDLDAARLRSANEEHAKILAAIRRGAAGAAADHAYRHASSSMRLVVQELGWEEALREIAAAADGNGTASRGNGRPQRG